MAETQSCTPPVLAHEAELPSGQDGKDENSLQGEDMEDDMPRTQPAFAQEAHEADVKAEMGEGETLAGEVCGCPLSFLSHTCTWFARHHLRSLYVCQIRFKFFWAELNASGARQQHPWSYIHTLCHPAPSCLLSRRVRPQRHQRSRS